MSFKVVFICLAPGSDCSLVPKYTALSPSDCLLSTRTLLIALHTLRILHTLVSDWCQHVFPKFLCQPAIIFHVVSYFHVTITLSSILFILSRSQCSLSLLSSHSHPLCIPLSYPFRARFFLYLCFIPDIPIYSFQSSQLFSFLVTFAFSFLKNLPVIVMNQKRLLEKLPLSING